MRPIVSLYEHAGLGLILDCSSGVAYSNQAGGTSCLHPEQEGVFVPLCDDSLLPSLGLISPASALEDYFAGPKWRGTGATKGIDEADADFIDGLLASHQLAHCMRVDRERLQDSCEAWIRVQVLADEGAIGLAVFEGFGPYPRGGVLTWPNSD